MALALFTAALLSHAAAAEPVPSELEAWRSQRIAVNPPRISSAAIQRALAGEAVHGVETDGGPGRGWVVQKVDLAVEALWGAIVDNDHQAEFFQIDQSKVIGGNPTDRYTFQLLELPVVTDRWWVVRQRFNSSLYQASEGRVWEVSWIDHLEDTELLSTLSLPSGSMPVVGAEGSWFLVDLGNDQTLVEYYCWTDIGGLVPQSVAAKFAAGAVDRHINSVVEMARDHECEAEGVRPDGSPL